MKNSCKEKGNPLTIEEKDPINGVLEGDIASAGGKAPKGPNRRHFLAQLGLGSAAASLAAGTLAAPFKAAAQPPSGCALPPGYPPVVNVPLGPGGRIAAATILRGDEAATDARLGPAVNLSNGDSEIYPSLLGNFTKGLTHNQYGVVNPGSWESLVSALQSGSFAAFEAVKTGGQLFPPGQNKTLNGPQGGYQYDLEGPDVVQFGQPQVPPAPSVASDQTGTELVEMYWASLLRDVAFTEYPGNSVAQMAAEELTGMLCYTGPRNSSGQVTPNLLFRGTFPGETMGPYVSQFLLQPGNLGATPISQQMISYQAGIDYMTDFSNWLKVQDGWLPPYGNVTAGPYYVYDGRGMGALSNLDVLYNEYLIAAAVLNTIGAPLNPGNPYLNSKTENGFVTFGGPDFFSSVGAAAAHALAPTWYQKWWVHMRCRPEAAGGIVYLNKNNIKVPGGVTMSNTVLNSKALQESYNHTWNDGVNPPVTNSWLLSQGFASGSPTHPAYPTGHGTVGGVCITILKFIWNGDYIIPNPVVSAPDGSSLMPYTGSDANRLSVNGELNKLGHNVTFAHGIFPGIHWRSDSDTSLLIGEQIGLAFLQDKAMTYNEPFSITITKFDGTKVTISNKGNP